MVTIKLSGGLGNQLFQYAAARSLSIYKKASLLIDLQEYEFSQKRTYRLNCFKINENLEGSNNKGTKYSYFTMNKKIKNILSKFHSYIPLPINYYFDHSWKTNFNFYKLSYNVTLEGSFANLFYFDSIRDILINELQLKEDLVSSDFIQYHKLIEQTNSVSLHIRRGDYVAEKQTLFAQLECEYYLHSFDYMNKHQKNLCFFIFSDDITWAKQNLSYLPNCYFVENLPDYQDLVIMSSCKHNIIANSTFSWWAAYLNQNPKKIILYPYKWYKQDELNAKKKIFLPTAWIEIK